MGNAIRRSLIGSGILLAMVLSSRPPSCADPAGPSLEELLTRAERHFNEEEYNEALQAADQILSASPSCKAALLCKARCQNRLNLRANAIETLERILAAAPNDRDALLAKGSNLALLGKQDEAMAVFKQLLQEHPHDGLAWYNLGTLQRESNQPDAASASFQKVQTAFMAGGEAMPGEVKYMLAYQLGLLAMARQEYARAVEHLRDALAERPWSETVHYQMGQAYARMGKRDESRRWMDSFNRIQSTNRRIIAAERLIAQSPHSATPYLVVAQLYFSNGDYGRAERYANKALTQEPSNPNALNALGMTLVRQNRLDEARPVFDAAIQAGGGVEALVNRGSLALQEGQLEAAERFYREALARRPDFAPARQGLAQVQQARQPRPEPAKNPE